MAETKKWYIVAEEDSSFAFIGVFGPFDAWADAMLYNMSPGWIEPKVRLLTADEALQLASEFVTKP